MDTVVNDDMATPMGTCVPVAGSKLATVTTATELGTFRISFRSESFNASLSGSRLKMSGSTSTVSGSISNSVNSPVSNSSSSSVWFPWSALSFPIPVSGLNVRETSDSPRCPDPS